MNSDKVFRFQQNIWDEENRLIGTTIDGLISRYTFDAFGERTLKSIGELQGIFVNGAPAGFVEHNKNITAHISPYFSLKNDRYFKHYFVDNRRILTKEVFGEYDTNLGIGQNVSAGQLDYKSRIQQYEQSILNYYEQQGIPPGPPTLIGYIEQPELTLESLPDASNENPYNSIPAQWLPFIPEPDSSGPPGPPVFYNETIMSNAEVLPGYGFNMIELMPESQMYFYHYDIAGNVIMITNALAQPIQWNSYLPSGELWNNWKTEDIPFNYLHNAKEYDVETALYYYGDMHYNPQYQLAFNVDRIEQNFGRRTLSSRIEGDFFYDYAYDEDEVSFDTEILNSEKPNFLASSQPNDIDFSLLKYENHDDKKNVFRDETTLLSTKSEKRDIKMARRNFSFSPLDDDKTVEARIEFAESFEAYKNIEFFKGEKLDLNKRSVMRKIKKQRRKDKKALNRSIKKNQSKPKVRIR